MPDRPYRHEKSMTRKQRDQLIPFEVLEQEIELCAKRAAECRAAHVRLPATTEEGEPVTGRADYMLRETERYWNVRFLAAQRLLWEVLGGFQAFDNWLAAKGIEEPRTGYIVP